MENERYFYIDRLRVFLICYIIFHQSLIAFGGIGPWYYTSADRFVGTSLIVVNTVKTINISFMMGLYFITTAMLAYITYQKHGFRNFVKTRLIVLGIPLLLYVTLFHPSYLYFVAKTKGNVEIGWLQFVIDSLSHKPTFGSFWFVALLLVFELAYAFLKKFYRKKTERVLSMWDHITPFRTTLFIICIGTVSFIIRLVSPASTIGPGIKWGFYTLYLGTFIVGLIGQRFNWISQLRVNNSVPWLIFSFLCLPMLLFSLHYVKDWSVFTGGMNSQSLFYALWEPMVCVGICMFLMSFFHSYLNHPGKLSVKLSEMSFTAYFFYPVPIVLFTYLFESMDIPVFFKWFFTGALSCIASFALAYVIYRILKKWVPALVE